MKKIYQTFLAFIFIFISQMVPAAIMFDFTYADTGNGFDDVTLGASRRSALESAASTLGSYFTDTRTLNIDVNPSQSDGSGALASAGTFYSLIDNSFQEGIAQQEVLRDEISDTATHGEMTWDFGFSYDLDDNIAAGTYDFKFVAMHELLHVLGFASLVNVGGASIFAGITTNTWGSFDQFLADGDGNRLINNGATKDFNASEVADLTGGTGTDPASSNTGVYFDGANAVAANGGNLIPLYSPSVFKSGSSISHLDTDFFGTNTTIMSHAISTGQGLRTLSGIELGILQDLGYSVTAVPVPPAILLLGSGLMALFGFKRKSLVN